MNINVLDFDINIVIQRLTIVERMIVMISIVHGQAQIPNTVMYACMHMHINVIMLID